MLFALESEPLTPAASRREEPGRLAIAINAGGLTTAAEAIGFTVAMTFRAQVPLEINKTPTKKAKGLFISSPLAKRRVKDKCSVSQSKSLRDW